MLVGGENGNMTIAEAVQAVLTAADRFTGIEDDRELPDALNAVAELGEADRREVRQRLAGGFDGVASAAGAGVLAIWFGAGVEQGVDPKISGASVTRGLVRWCRRLPGEPSELNQVLARGLEMLGQSAVAHLSRDPDLLASLRNDEEAVEILAAAEARSVGAMWVMQLLRLQGGELIVLHGIERKGFLVRYENLANCFHFFTLLQAALTRDMPGAQQVPEKVLAVAQGAIQEEVYDHAWWHYGQPTSPSPSLETMVFGEMPLDSIDRVDGAQVMLLWPPLVESRSWDGSFFCPHLMAAPPRVKIIRELGERELNRWRTRLNLPVGG